MAHTAGDSCDFMVFVFMCDRKFLSQQKSGKKRGKRGRSVGGVGWMSTPGFSPLCKSKSLHYSCLSVKS